MRFDARAALPAPHGRFWRIKAILATAVFLASFVGLALAALLLGSLIAAVLVILVTVVVVFVAFKALVRYLRST